MLDLISDPDYYCLDTSSLTAVQSYTFGQPGFAPRLFTFRVATCDSILGTWF